MEFRAVTVTDADLLADLFSDLDPKFFRPHAFTPEAAAAIAHRTGRDLYAMLLDDGRPVAYGMLRGWDDGFDTPMLGVAVRDDSRGRGLGRLMMGFLHAEAQARGAALVKLRVHPHNAAARRLYESMGYAYHGADRGELLMTRQVDEPPG